MKLTVCRSHFLDSCTVGRLLIDGADAGLFTLEPKARAEKIEGVTAIPVGTYPLVIDFSAHFMKYLPHVLNVPGFTGVRIHPGNTDKDTAGCILLGTTWNGGDFIGESREAFKEIFAKIKASETPVEIEIV